MWFDDDLYIIEKFALRIIMNCRVLTPKAIQFRSLLGFKQHDIIITRTISKNNEIICKKKNTAAAFCFRL